MRTEAYRYTGPHESPAAAISLRAIDPDRFTIVNEAAGGEVMEEIEESKAFYEVYDGAVYMFQVCSWSCACASHTHACTRHWSKIPSMTDL